MISSNVPHWSGPSGKVTSIRSRSRFSFWTFWRSRSGHVRKRDWMEEDLFQLVRRAYPYLNLTRKFDAILEMAF